MTEATIREKLNKAISETLGVMFNNGITGQEYLFILQTLTATSLAVNAKSTENEYLRNLKKDTLDRRLQKVRKENAQAS